MDSETRPNSLNVQHEVLACWCLAADWAGEPLIIVSFFSHELSVCLQTCYKESWELNSAAIAVSRRKKNKHKHESLMCILQMSLLTSIALVCLSTSRIWWLFMVISVSLSGLVGHRGLLLAETIWEIHQQIEEELRDLPIKLTEMCMQIDSQTSINYTTLTTSSTACFTISIE